MRGNGSWNVLLALAPLLALATWIAAKRPRPQVSLPQLAFGIAVGLVMIAVAHGAYRLAVALVPGLPTVIAPLYDFLQSEGAPTSLALRVGAVAVCEEFVFRGPMLGPVSREGTLHQASLQRVLLLAAASSLAQATFGDIVLCLLVFVCASAWGWLRVRLNSIGAAIACHLTFSIGMFVALPLPR